MTLFGPLRLILANSVQLFLLYSMEREVPGLQRSALSSRPFGVHMDINKLVAQQVGMLRMLRMLVCLLALWLSFARPSCSKANVI
jgi:hypothetical protein